MTDIVAAAEQLLNDAAWCRACKVEQPPFPNALITALVAELKTTRAQLEQRHAPASPHGFWKVVIGGEPEEVYVTAGSDEISISGMGSIHADEARALAAVLLAAAAAAEKVSNG